VDELLLYQQAVSRMKSRPEAPPAGRVTPASVGLRRGLVFGGTEEILGDEPDWTGLLTVVTIELDERDVRAGALASVDEITKAPRRGTCVTG
jgi:hypothetical protein